MSIAQQFLSELKDEAVNTRKLLALVPFDQADFKPHEKSMTLKRLANHVVEIACWWKECLVMDELDFAKSGGPGKSCESAEELLAWYDELLVKAEGILNDTPDEAFAKNWTMRHDETIFFTMPKQVVVRTWCLNHWYHHRGQLTVYLRLLNIPLPGVYGPTADNPGM